MGRPSKYSIALLLAAPLSPIVSADDLLYRYEGDVFPYDPSAGWIPSVCEYPCRERLEAGRFVLNWAHAADHVQYLYRVAVPREVQPPSLWVEWHFRSNHALGPVFFSCDAGFMVDYKNVVQVVNMYGDAVISFSGDDYVLGLNLNEFHTYRFESWDGLFFQLSVDGLVFLESPDVGTDNGYANLLFSGHGGCNGDQFPGMENEWDFIRYGTLGEGEQVIASDPAEGFLDARRGPIDRVVVTYDAPNYVYIDDVAVESTRIAPAVIATKRLDNGEPDEVQIVFDAPLPFRATTHVVLSDGLVSEELEFIHVPGDTDGDGDADLADFSYLQNCPGPTSPCPLLGKEGENCGPCLALDADESTAIDLLDYADFESILTGPD